MNEWDEEEVAQEPKEIHLQVPEKVTIVDQEQSEELTFTVGEETSPELGEESDIQVENPLTEKEQGFMKIEELLGNGKISETQAEEYFVRISSGDIVVVMQELTKK